MLYLNAIILRAISVLGICDPFDNSHMAATINAPHGIAPIVTIAPTTGRK